MFYFFTHAYMHHTVKTVTALYKIIHDSFGTSVMANLHWYL